MIVKRVEKKEDGTEKSSIYECSTCEYEFLDEGIFRVELYDIDMNRINVLEVDTEVTFYIMENGKTVDCIGLKGRKAS